MDNVIIFSERMDSKAVEQIINAIGQSVRIIGVIKPIYNFKAGE